jgi:hypothetical protein
MKAYTTYNTIRILRSGILWCGLIQSVFLAAIQPVALAGEWKQIQIPPSQTVVLHFFFQETNARIQQLNSPPEGMSAQVMRQTISSEYSATEADLQAIVEISASLTSNIQKMDRAQMERNGSGPSDPARAAQGAKQRDLILQTAFKTLRERLSPEAQAKLEAMLNGIRGRISGTRLLYVE